MSNTDTSAAQRFEEEEAQRRQQALVCLATELAKMTDGQVRKVLL